MSRKECDRAKEFIDPDGRPDAGGYVRLFINGPGTFSTTFSCLR